MQGQAREDLRSLPVPQGDVLEANQVSGTSLVKRERQDDMGFGRNKGGLRPSFH